MLGTIAKKLRILGFDSKYFTTIEDDDLILIAKKENRAVITKDHSLADNAKKHDILTIEISTLTEKEQMVEIAKNLNIKYEFNTENVRCSTCNGSLRLTEKDQVLDKIPPKISENVKEFWLCDGCKHVYWKGTHIRNLQRFIAEINDSL
jgi:uncharacterized protein with PIN domain